MELTQKELQDLFYYIDGRLIWKVGKRKGKPAGCKEKLGYVRVWIGTKRYYEHQLVYTFCHGKTIERPNVTDHINHDRADNTISNLREATRKENWYNVPANA